MSTHQTTRQQLIGGACVMVHMVQNVSWYSEWFQRTCDGIPSRLQVYIDEVQPESGAPFAMICTDEDGPSLELFGGDVMIQRLPDGQWELNQWKQEWNRDNGNADSDYCAVGTYTTINRAINALIMLDAQEFINWAENMYNSPEYDRATLDHVVKLAIEDGAICEQDTAEELSTPPNNGM